MAGKRFVRQEQRARGKANRGCTLGPPQMKPRAPEHVIVPAAGRRKQRSQSTSESHRPGARDDGGHAHCVESVVAAGSVPQKHSLELREQGKRVVSSRSIDDRPQPRHALLESGDSEALRKAPVRAHCKRHAGIIHGGSLQESAIDVVDDASSGSRPAISQRSRGNDRRRLNDRLWRGRLSCREDEQGLRCQRWDQQAETDLQRATFEPGMLETYVWASTILAGRS